MAETWRTLINCPFFRAIATTFPALALALLSPEGAGIAPIAVPGSAIERYRVGLLPHARTTDTPTRVPRMCPELMSSKPEGDDGDGPEDRVTVIESMCMNCHKNGTTRMMLTVIPYFKEVILCSFECPHCFFRNNEVLPGASLRSQGVKWTLTLQSVKDLNRQVIKSEHGTIRIPSLEFEIPPNTQRGLSSTVQGIIDQAALALSQEQSNRRTESPELFEQVEAFIGKLKKLSNPTGGESGSDSQFPFTMELIDASGNSFVESLTSPAADPQLVEEKFTRTTEQMHEMGFYEEQREGQEDVKEQEKKGADLPTNLRAGATWNLAATVEENVDQHNQAQQAGTFDSEEGIEFDIKCPNCGKDGKERMCEIDIPGFRKCMVMSFVCLNCGSRSNEVKPSGAVGEKARKWTLTVSDRKDLDRDVLKSDSASVEIPELDFSMEMGTLGGVFTTVEGLLRKTISNLNDCQPFMMGDSAKSEIKLKMGALIDNLEKAANGELFPFTLVLDDAADHSHIGRRDANLLFLTGVKKAVTGAADEEDPNLMTSYYQRTEEQNDDLGLTGMKVENYEEGNE